MTSLPPKLRPPPVSPPAAEQRDGKRAALAERGWEAWPVGHNLQHPARALEFHPSGAVTVKWGEQEGQGLRESERAQDWVRESTKAREGPRESEQERVRESASV